MSTLGMMLIETHLLLPIIDTMIPHTRDLIGVDPSGEEMEAEGILDLRRNDMKTNISIRGLEGTVQGDSSHFTKTGHKIRGGR